VPCLLVIVTEGDDRLDLFSYEQFSQRVRVVAFIGNESAKVEFGEQRFCLAEVMTFTTSQNEL